MPKPKSLIGMCFHSFHPSHSRYAGKVDWQGEVIGFVTSKTLILQLFSWMDGTCTFIKIVPLEYAMQYFQFYPSCEAMNWWYENKMQGTEQVRTRENG